MWVPRLPPGVNASSFPGVNVSPRLPLSPRASRPTHRHFALLHHQIKPMADSTTNTEMPIPDSPPAVGGTPNPPSAISTPAPSAVEDPSPPRAKIPPPPGPLLAAKAGTVNKLLAWNPDDFIIANRSTLTLSPNARNYIR